MNDLVAKALEEMGVGFRYLNGQVKSQDRGALYTEFNSNPDVRVFLSTDAGGVGLNLQSAAWLINLDIPWNPGVLEQRIGRIHRLGQEKPVNIINLVAQETIEHNLLGVIQFKKSMAAGVLDDGEETIFMGDSKFKQFMASVETITRDTVNGLASVSPDEIEAPVAPSQTNDEDLAPNAAPQPKTTPLPNELPDDLDTPLPSESNSSEQTPGVRPQTPENLVQHGVQFFSQLARTLSDKDATERLVKTIVQKDEKTGQTYVRLPVENEQAVEGVLKLLGGLFNAMAKGG